MAAQAALRETDYNEHLRCLVRACLTQVSLDFHGGVEDSQNLNPLLIGNEVGYAVVPVEDLTHFTISNVLVNLIEAARCFQRPDYFCHASIFRFTSLSMTVRPAFESSKPRWTIRSYASWRSNSS